MVFQPMEDGQSFVSVAIGCDDWVNHEGAQDWAGELGWYRGVGVGFGGGSGGGSGGGGGFGSG